MATAGASVIGWAVRRGTVWYPSSGTSSLSSYPVATNDAGYISSPSGNNKYTVMIAVQTPSDSSISSISKLSITFNVYDRNTISGTLYGSLRTVSQSSGSDTDDTDSTFRNNAIGSEASTSSIGSSTSGTSVTFSFSGSFSPGRTYYLFLYTKSTNDIYTVNAGSSNFSAEITYSVITYVIKYDANGGFGAPGQQVKAYDGVIALSNTTPIKEDTSAGSYEVTLNANGGSCSTLSLSADRTTSYAFSHWNTEADGSGISYASGTSYTANASVTLYAIYSSATTTAPVYFPTPIRNGYEFLGWNVSNTADTGITGSYTPEKDITFYAIWKAKGLVYIYDGTQFVTYQVYIYTGSSWDLCCPYVYDGTTWSMCA